MPDTTLPNVATVTHIKHALAHRHSLSSKTEPTQQNRKKRINTRKPQVLLFSHVICYMLFNSILFCIQQKTHSALPQIKNTIFFFSFRILHNASVFLPLFFFNDKDKYNTTFFLLKVKRLIDAPLRRRRAGQKVQRAHTRTWEEINNTASAAGRGEEVGWWVEHRRHHHHCTTGEGEKNGAEQNSPLAHSRTNGCGGGRGKKQAGSGSNKNMHILPRLQKNSSRGHRQQTAAATTQSILALKGFFPPPIPNMEQFDLTRYSSLPLSFRTKRVRPISVVITMKSAGQDCWACQHLVVPRMYSPTNSYATIKSRINW